MKKLLLALLVLSFATMAFANAQGEGASAKTKEYSIFLGYEKDDYPQAGTIFGNWLEEKTGVKIAWEFIVGDLEQKVGLIAASGDYPDAIHPRNNGHILLGANALIPLNDLVEAHGPNIKDLYGERIEMIKKPDGNIYWFPQQMPYGDVYRSPNPGHGVYIQQAVLESWDYKMPKDLDDAVDKLIAYAKANPEINGKKTLAWSGQYDSWRWFGTSNIPHILSGHPNDGSCNVDKVGTKWVATHYWGTKDEYESYRILNKVHQAGLYDVQSFVMSYDQYIASLTGGNVLAFYDQDWNFQNAQSLLLDQDQGRWYIATTTMLPGYEPTILNPPTPQVSEGIGISVSCKDPEGLMQYFNFLADKETLLLRGWGREGIDYMVGDDGVFYRTEEQVERWQDVDWRNEEYGADYWVNFLWITAGSVIWDGKNNIDPGNQPSLYRMNKRPAEIEALDAMGIDTFADIFPQPDLDRSVYFPAWTITIPPDSKEGITNAKLDDIRRKNIPLLIMAKPGEYDKVWNDYLKQMNTVPQADIDALDAFRQAEIDRRVLVATGKPNK
ncbi:MAG: extracellular solute-binding protein [Spirochaetales bacterium]|nr:extracellular solute-binding protein [Spirochaetales bacterium]